MSAAAQTEAQGRTGQTVASGSSFYAGMRVLPKAEREAMFAIYGFCRQVDDIADDQGAARTDRRAQLDGWRADLHALYAGADPGRARFLVAAVNGFSLRLAEFLAVIDGMEMDVDADIRAPDLATLTLYCDRVACAVGRLSVKVFGMDDASGLKLARHLGLALQFTNILRDLDEDAAIGRMYLPQELLSTGGLRGDDPKTIVGDPRVDQPARALARMAQDHYTAADELMQTRPRGRLIAPRLMSAVYARVLAKMCAQGWRPPRKRVGVNKVRLLWTVLRHGLLG